MANSPDQQTLNYYNNEAESFSARYESAPPNPLLPQIVPKGTTLLDIGCGTGRDLALLNSLDIRVNGMEPSEPLLTKARRLHPEIAHRLFQGSLPGSIPEMHDTKFDTVLLSAILMHIPDTALFNSGLAIRGLLKPQGRVIISVPVERDDVKPSSNRTSDGRLMILRPSSRSACSLNVWGLN